MAKTETKNYPQQGNPDFWLECIGWLKDNCPGFVRISQYYWRKNLRPPVLAEYDNTCAWCGFQAHHHMGVDHVMTKHEGGGDVLKNLQLLCCRCNSIKREVSLPKLRPWAQKPIPEEAGIAGRHASSDEGVNARRAKLSAIVHYYRHVRGLRGTAYVPGT